MILKPLYAFKYYPYKGLKLTRLDPLKGNITGYVDDYREYAQALRENPKLKKHYDSTNTADRRKLKETLENLFKYQFNHASMIREAMRLGVLREDIEKLISQKDKLMPKKYINEPIDLDDVPKSLPSLKERPENIYVSEVPKYLSLEERKKRIKKTKIKRKMKKCRCKK